MFVNYSNLLFMSITIMGVMVSISSSSWLIIWIGMEINLMSFIPLISIKSILNSEFLMKYFIVQSISSMIVMFSLMMIMMNINLFMMIMLSSLIMKMGGAPFHNWVVSTIDGLHYESVFMLLVIMKISPLMMTSFMNLNLMMFSSLSLIIGSINGLNQSSIIKLMTFSSIYNLGLMLYSLSMNSIWIMALIIYSFILTSFLILLKKFKFNYINQMVFNNSSKFSKILIIIPLLSLGGMPPFLGFQMKMMIFELMMLNNNLLLISIMVFSSLVIMYFYLNMIVSSLMFSSISMKFMSNKKMKINFDLVILMINLVMFFPMMLMKFMI
uniref:NADH-ubiquinone oxidoreductase chain 2 n=1 Tax=Gessius rufidorsus TaxID=1971641 RepID=A0A6C0MD33_9HEMI|nr:NADH dehydrogenase subunit 2 [Gessius sp. 'rufidorsus']